MKKKTIIMICAIIVVALIGVGTAMRYGATQNDGIENAELGDSYASKYNGKKCGVRNGREYCKCYGCSAGNRDASKCSRCGHRCDQHTR